MHRKTNQLQLSFHMGHQAQAFLMSTVTYVLRGVCCRRVVGAKRAERLRSGAVGDPLVVDVGAGEACLTLQLLQGSFEQMHAS